MDTLHYTLSFCMHYSLVHSSFWLPYCLAVLMYMFCIYLISNVTVLISYHVTYVWIRDQTSKMTVLISQFHTTLLSCSQDLCVRSHLQFLSVIHKQSHLLWIVRNLLWSRPKVAVDFFIISEMNGKILWICWYPSIT